MIQVRLMGGLGNQMFQYSMARAASLRQGLDLGLDLSFLKDMTPKENFTPRAFSLDSFNYKGKLVHNSQVSKLTHLFHKKVTGKILVESSFRFDPKFLMMRDNVLAIGYFQSEEYFRDKRSELIEDFQLNRCLSEASEKYKSSIAAAQNSVSLHVRRGDYISNPTVLKVHGLCSLEYYKSALGLLKSSEAGLSAFIFSDDNDWVRENLILDIPTTYIENHLGKPDFEDLHLMSLCRHNIIANSSYSWWGAWLNQNKNKKVFAPLRWFADPSIDTKDVIPRDWIKVP